MLFRDFPKQILLEKELTDQATFTKTQAYGLDKNTFTLFKGAFAIIESIIFVYFGYAFFWKSCGALVGPSVYYQSLVFMITYQVFEQVLTAPFDLFSIFVIEEKHGFNKQTLKLWASDQLKSMVIGVVVICILVPIVLWIVDYFGDSFVLYLWITLSLFLLLFMWLVPEVIMPLFYKFETLDEAKHCKTEKTKGFPKFRMA